MELKQTKKEVGHLTKKESKRERSTDIKISRRATKLSGTNH